MRSSPWHEGWRALAGEASQRRARASSLRAHSGPSLRALVDAAGRWWRSSSVAVRWSWLSAPHRALGSSLLLGLLLSTSAGRVRGERLVGELSDRVHCEREDVEVLVELPKRRHATRGFFRFTTAEHESISVAPNRAQARGTSARRRACTTARSPSRSRSRNVAHSPRRAPSTTITRPPDLDWILFAGGCWGAVCGGDRYARKWWLCEASLVLTPFPVTLHTTRHPVD
jgi:hypothetical protein